MTIVDPDEAPEDAPGDAGMPPPNYSVDSLIEKYRAELVTPPDERAGEISQSHLEPHLDELFSDLYVLREATDRHFLGLRDRMLQRQIEVGEEQ